MLFFLLHPWVKGIQVCLNEGPNPLPRGDYYKNSENTTNFGTKHPWVRIQMKKNNELFYFFSPNQRYDIIICVYWFELFSQMSDVAHGPLVSSEIFKFNTFKYCKDNNSSKSSLFSVTLHFWYSFYFFDFMCKRVTNNILALQKLFSWFYGWLFQVMLCIFRVCLIDILKHYFVSTWT